MKFILSTAQRQAVVEKEMNPKIYKVIQAIAGVVNFIATRPLINRRILTIMSCVATTGQYLSDLAPELKCMS